MYQDPPAGWTYIFRGHAAKGGAHDSGVPALDGTWSNGPGVDSDRWAGDGRGTGNGPKGGVETSFGVLTMEDAETSGSGNSNQKLYFIHTLGQDGVTNNNLLDTGVTLSFRARLTPPDGREEITLPNGSGIFSAGQGMFSIRQNNPFSIISFSLVRTNEDKDASGNLLRFSAAGLTMNRLNGNSPAGAAVESTTNAADNPIVPLDPTVFHEFWITIQSNGAAAGTHLVNVYVDGDLVGTNIHVTAGTNNSNGGSNFLALGLNQTAAVGAFDTDFFAYTTNVIAPAAPVTVTLGGATNTQVFTNPVSLPLDSEAQASPSGTLLIYDGARLVFVQPNPGANIFTNLDVPLGVHSFQAAYREGLGIPNGPTNRSPVINVRVDGGTFGFYAVSNLVTRELANVGTLISCDLAVRNDTSAASNPLRIRLLSTQTFSYNRRLSNAPPAFPPPAETNLFVTNLTLGPSSSFVLNLPTNLNLICPLFQKGNNPYPPPPDNFAEAGTNFHIYAVLEEQLGTNWTKVDRTRIISGEPQPLYPPDPGQIQVLPDNGNDNFLLSLAILGTNRVNEGSLTNYFAVAAFSDGASGAVNAAWSVLPTNFASAFSTLGFTGRLAAPAVSSSTTITLQAQYQRGQTKSNFISVQILDLGDPPTISLQPTNTNVFSGLPASFSVIATGASPLAYQWQFNGQPVAGALTNLLSINPARPSNTGPYTVVIANLLGAITSAPATLTVNLPAVPVFTSAILSNQQMSLTYTGEVSYPYFLDYSTNPASTGAVQWLPLIQLVNTNGTTRYLESSSNTLRLYRVRGL
ncbi:MAG: immunoglobulin domain-containing protein [Verrucomicrobia bacterium]|nr:immunoglobulin domain-containing protein [Verrucomicrobiota bacterium]